MKKYLSKYFRLLAVVFIFLFYIDVSFALVISEIQFDPAGSDTDREWVEIFNDTSASIDLTTYKFFENNTNHGIDILSGDKNVASGEYVVLIQDLNKFKTDYPTYMGKIFKSSFSLSNTGESLSLKDKDGNILNTVNYSPSATGAGNGLTINFDGTNYAKASATPGTGNLSVNNSNNSDNNSNSQNSTSTATSTQTTSTTTATSTSGTQNVDSFSTPIYFYRSYFPESEKIYVYAGENQVGVTGAQLFFNAKSVTGDKRPVNGAEYFWSFGDGETAEGEKVSHIYKYNGEYVVTLEGYSGGSKNEDRIYVRIIDPNLDISLINKNNQKFVQIKNNNSEQVDIGGDLIKSSGGEFEKVSTLPRRLIILPGKSTVLAQDILKFATSTNYLSLMYNNGLVISELKGTTTVTIATTSTSTLKKVPRISFKIVKKIEPEISLSTTTNIDKVEDKFVIKDKQEGLFASFFSYFGI